MTAPAAALGSITGRRPVAGRVQHEPLDSRWVRWVRVIMGANRPLGTRPVATGARSGRQTVSCAAARAAPRPTMGSDPGPALGRVRTARAPSPLLGCSNLYC